jgi:hypothetical protein
VARRGTAEPRDLDSARRLDQQARSWSGQENHVRVGDRWVCSHENDSLRAQLFLRLWRHSHRREKGDEET